MYHTNQDYVNTTTLFFIQFIHQQQQQQQQHQQQQQQQQAALVAATSSPAGLAAAAAAAGSYLSPIAGLPTAQLAAGQAAGINGLTSGVSGVVTPTTGKNFLQTAAVRRGRSEICLYQSYPRSGQRTILDVALEKFLLFLMLP